MQLLIGKSQFSFESEKNLIILSTKDIPPLHFNEDEIDTNAIKLFESISTISDTTFEQSANLDKNHIIHAAIAGMEDTLELTHIILDPKRVEAQNKGLFEGVDLKITTKDGVITVVSPMMTLQLFVRDSTPMTGLS